MILNEKEKAELITALKKQYENGQELLKADNSYLLQTEEDRVKFMRDNEELKERIETLESKEVCEIEINHDFFKSDGSWLMGIICLALLFGLGNNSPDNNSNLN